MKSSSGSGEEDPNSILLQSCVAGDLHDEIIAHAPRVEATTTFPVMLEMNKTFPGGARMARAAVVASYLRTSSQPEDSRIGYLGELLALANAQDRRQDITFMNHDALNLLNSSFTEGYLFGELTVNTIRKIAAACRADRQGPVYKIWLDQPCEGYVYKSYKTVKCDAARIAFGAQGEDIVWAVADTGIDGTHRHFQTHDTLKPPPGLTISTSRSRIRTPGPRQTRPYRTTMATGRMSPTSSPERPACRRPTRTATPSSTGWTLGSMRARPASRRTRPARLGRRI